MAVESVEIPGTFVADWDRDAGGADGEVTFRFVPSVVAGEGPFWRAVAVALRPELVPIRWEEE